jgi:hypothetical protein
MSGSDLAKAKEAAAQKMREKQAAGMRPSPPIMAPLPPRRSPILIAILCLADAKKTAEAGGAK